MGNTDLSIIIPAYNESECLDALFIELSAVINKLHSRGVNTEVIVVDDHSNDGSWQKLSEIKDKYNWVRSLRLLKNSGSHIAIYAGLKHSRGKNAFIISADLQAKPDLIFDFLKSREEGYQVVLGNRESRNDPKVKKLISSIFNIFVSKFVMKNFPMNGGDVFLISRNIIDAIIECNEKNVNIFVLILSLCNEVGQVPYKREDRFAGKSKWDIKKLTKLAYDTIITVSNLPFRFIFWTGIIIFIFSMFYILLVILLKMLGVIKIEGWASLLVAISGFGDLSLISISILGEYLWRNFDQTRNRPLFLIEEEK